jgi:hypothetical protein
LLRDNQSSMRFDAPIAWPAQCVARCVPFSSVKYSLRKDHLGIEKFFNFPGSVSIPLLLLHVSDRKSLKPIHICRLPFKFSSYWRKIYQDASVYNQKSSAVRDQSCLASEEQPIPFRGQSTLDHRFCGLQYFHYVFPTTENKGISCVTITGFSGGIA